MALFRTLAFKVGAVIILIEVAVLAATGLVFFSHFSNQVDRRIESQLRLPGQLINAGLMRFESIADRETMARLIDNEVETAFLVGLDGMVYYSLDPQWLGQTMQEIPDLDPQLFNLSEGASRVSSRTNTMRCVSPIFGADGVTPRFYLYIESSTSAAAREKRTLLMVFFGGVVLAIAASSALIVLVFRLFMLSRITRTLGVLRRVEMGDFSAHTELTGADDELGALDRGIGSMTDTLAHTIARLEKEIEDHGRAETALQQSETRYRTLVDSFRDIVYIADYDRRILFANPSLQRVTGFSVEELRDPSTIRRQMHPDDLEHVDRFLRAFVASDESYSGQVENRFSDRAGTLHWFSSSVTKINYSGIPALQIVVRDITEQKLAEQALRTRERFLSCLNDISVALLKNQNPVDVMHQVVEGLGTAAAVARCSVVECPTPGDEAHWRRRLAWIHPDYQETATLAEDQGFSAEVLDATSTLGTLARGEMVQAAIRELGPREREHFGSQGIESILAAPILRGETWCGFLLFEDVAADRDWAHEKDLLRIAAIEVSSALENHRLLQEVQGYAIEMADRVAARTAELETLNRELASFAYSVSHDLRAPLRSINGFSRFLVEDYSAELDDRGRDYLERIRASSQRMGILIDELLELSRVTRSDMQRIEVDLSRMTKSLFQELTEARPELDARLAIASGMTVKADPNLLSIVMQNLLENALKFSSLEEIASIDVGQLCDGAEHVFFVRDNGAGFDMKYKDKLFGVFQRLHSETEYPGTGIGLATVKRIVERHGGRIWAEAEPGAGATFFFTLCG